MASGPPRPPGSERALARYGTVMVAVIIATWILLLYDIVADGWDGRGLHRCGRIWQTSFPS
ncbi:MAG: hypothetical protein KY460_01065 [Actinobacteria bacterium]|nr:hypothetical protein [Actinomycetota bacterium]